VEVSAREIVIEPGGQARRYWADLWRYRELLFFLAWRDVKVRYKQAALGVAWAVVQPLVTMVLFTFVFGTLAGMHAGATPYPLLVLAWLLPWQLFAGAFAGASGSLVSNANLVSKVYFPRLVIPLAAVAVALVDFGVVLALYGGFAAWFGAWPTWRLLLLPVFTAMAVLVALGAGLWLTALSVRFRDFRLFAPFLLQVGVLVTPVGYRADAFARWHDVLALNPLTGVIDGFRWALLAGDHALSPLALGASLAGGAALLVSGLRVFRRTERTFADLI
jgi:lipopolysaccharide transport system permease protein